MGKFFGFFGSLASLVALLLTTGKNLIGTIGMFFGGLLLILAIIFEIIAYFKNKPLKFNRRENIDYMCKIIENEGKIIVFAGELSWIDSDKVKKTLKDKGKDLTLFAKDTAVDLEEYRAAGVNVCTYNDSETSPMARFTIIRPNQPTEKIAITSVLDDSRTEKRVVYEISNDDKDYKSKWIMCVAKDLINLIKTSQEER